VKEHLRGLSVSQDQLERSALAVSEAVGNVVRHAYLGGAGGELELEVDSDPDCFHVHVRDWGCGSANGPAETAGAGFGIPLMQAVSQEFVLDERWPRGTEVRMRFPLS
jgi:anti-sigma regulatory factor (Ser/Thr protein kinase)